MRAELSVSSSSEHETMAKFLCQMDNGSQVARMDSNGSLTVTLKASNSSIGENS